MPFFNNTLPENAKMPLRKSEFASHSLSTTCSQPQLPPTHYQGFPEVQESPCIIPIRPVPTGSELYTYWSSIITPFPLAHFQTSQPASQGIFNRPVSNSRNVPTAGQANDPLTSRISPDQQQPTLTPFIEDSSHSQEKQPTSSGRQSGLPQSVASQQSAAPAYDATPPTLFQPYSQQSENLPSYVPIDISGRNIDANRRDLPGDLTSTSDPARPTSVTAEEPQNPPVIVPTTMLESQKEWCKAAAVFVRKTLPRQIYLHLLLRLPLLYFSRVARILEEADLTLLDIKTMVLETAGGLTEKFDALSGSEAGIAMVPPQYQRLKRTWQSFIDSLLREWKTFNIISALLLPAILTILQIPSAAQDPLTRYSALQSLMCALLSRLFGCMYIIRFESMRKTYKAAAWALEAKKSETLIWWNVWVLLAMPAIWLAWSIVLCMACIMSFIWRTDAQNTQSLPVLSHSGLLLIRVLISSVFALGLLYMVLVLNTFRHYGDPMDRAWKRRIEEWLQERPRTHQSASRSAPYGSIGSTPVDTPTTHNAALHYQSNQPFSYTSNASVTHRESGVVASPGAFSLTAGMLA